MRTLVWLIALLLNLGVGAAFVPSTFEPNTPAKVRAFGVVFTLLFLTISGMLIAARLHRVLRWGRAGMKLACWAVPLLWLLGSLDHGLVSGLEFLSLILATLFGWGSWRAFLLFALQPNTAGERDASHPRR